MLSSQVYRENLRLTAVDDAHCISHWEFFAKRGEKAFRIWFRRINEVRSLVGGVALLALTATATKETRSKINKTLEMDKAVMFCSNPNRESITYAVQVIGSDPLATFKPLMEELKENRQACDRVIIYCLRIRGVSALYGIFKAELEVDIFVDRETCNPRERLGEMYHDRVDEQNKDEILASFSEESGCIRGLIATIAYGMGINCKGVKNVIHYGSSQNFERYLQESGRAGRSTDSQCRAVILYSNVMLQQCNESMINYIRNKNLICRRKLLLAHLDCDLTDLEPYSNPHHCCGICKEQSKCQGNSCSYVYFNIVLQQEGSKAVPKQYITSYQMHQLSNKLEYLKISLNNASMEMAIKSNLPL